MRSPLTGPERGDQVAGVHVIGLVVVDSSGAAVCGIVVFVDPGVLIAGAEGDLAGRTGSDAGEWVDIDLVDAEPLPGLLLPIEDDFFALKWRSKRPKMPPAMSGTRSVTLPDRRSSTLRLPPKRLQPSMKSV